MQRHLLGPTCLEQVLGQIPSGAAGILAPLARKIKAQQQASARFRTAQLAQLLPAGLAGLEGIDTE